MAYIVNVVGNQGFVSIDENYKEEEEEEEEEEEKRVEKEKEAKEEEKKRTEEKKTDIGCCLIRIIGFLVFAGIGYFIYNHYLKTPTYDYNSYSDESTAPVESKIPSVVEKISLDLFFNKSKDKIGHLRQDVESNIKAIGFVKKQFKEDDANDIAESSNYNAEGAAKYIYYSSNKEPLISISINKYLDDTLNEDNKGDKIKKSGD